MIASALEPGIVELGRVSSPDGAVTLMLGDIAGASDLAEQLGEERWSSLLRDYQSLVSQVLAHHDGELTRAEQDGFLASFASAHAGLHAAVELQRTFTRPGAGSGDGDDDGPAMAIRIGLHTGFVIANPDQPLGRNAVLASRIAARAGGGEILASSALKDYTASDPSFSFAFHGEYHFKGVLGEHAVYAVDWR